MKLFLTIEGQNATNNGLARICYELQNQLDFITNKNRCLESVDNYGKEFEQISIIPSCVSEELWNILGWKERVQIWRKKKEADVRLRIDYDCFIKADLEEQRLMFINVIIKSIKKVMDRSVGDFKGEELISDILDALNVGSNELDKFNTI